MNHTETSGNPQSSILNPQSLRFRSFQKEDLARGAIPDGLIASLDTGLGKSIYLYTWALLQTGWSKGSSLKSQDHGSAPSTLGFRPETLDCLVPNAPILLIVPGDLHAQMIREGWEKLRVQTRVIESQADYEALVRGPDGRPCMTEDGKPILPPGFYITSFTQLTTNGVLRRQDPLDADKPRHLLQQWALKEHSSHPSHLSYPANGEKPNTYENVTHLFTWRRFVWRDEFDSLQVDPNGSRKDLDEALQFQLAAMRHWHDPNQIAKRTAELERHHATLSNLFTLQKRPQYAQLTLAQQDFVIREFLVCRFEDYAINDGESKVYCLKSKAPDNASETLDVSPETLDRTWSVKCLYSPSLADHCHSAFDVIGIDEGVKMKGTDTYVGKGVRMMQARKRCVATATPIKNRLPDIFWLAWWAAGGQEEAHARFPYRNAASEHSDFSNTFMVSERNCTKELKAKAAGKPYRGRFVKLTAEICNVHRLWKLIAPIVLRRRKDECGEDLVPRIRKVVRVEMGTAQKAVYQYHLEAQYIDINGQKAVGAQLQALRTVAADPTSVLLQNKGEVLVNCTCKLQVAGCKLPKSAPRKPSTFNLQPSTCPKCNHTGKITLPHRSGNVYTPKFAAVLSLIHEIIARDEQVLIGTVFHESHDHLGGLLREAGIPFLLADGRTNPKQRGPLMQRFKDAEAPVCLGGLEAIANGHNLDTVNNVIIYAYSWAADLIKQFLDRVWRLTSRKPVNVYVVLCNGTVDRKLEALNWEKTDSIELALDGRLIGERSEEISLAELLNIAREEFNTEDKSVDEAAIQREWPQLKARLGDAMRKWTPDVPQRKSQVSSLKSQVARPNPRPAHSAAINPLIQQSNHPLPADWRTQMSALAVTLKASRAAVASDDLWASL